MKVTKEKEENREAVVTVELEPAEVKEAMDAALTRLSKRVRIGGFRPGKAPLALVERSLDKDRWFEEALRDIIPKKLDEVVKEQNLDVIFQPDVELTQKDPVIFRATIPLRPTITLGDYRSVRLEPKIVEVTEDQVNVVVERLRHQAATWDPVERPVKFDDFVVLDIESESEGKPYINIKKRNFNVLKDSKAPLAGFSEQLVDMKPGDTKEFKLTFPEDYSDKTAVGKEVSFKVTINEVKEENLPETNDDFAKRVDAKFDNLDAMKQQIKDDLKRQLDEQARQEFENQLIEAVAKDSKVEFPKVMLESEVHNLMEQQAQRLAQSGLGLEQYLTGVGKTMDQFHEELHAPAEKRITEALVLGKVVDEEKIVVPDGDVDAEIEMVLRGVTDKNRATVLKSLDTPDSRKSIRNSLLTRRALQRLTEIAKGPAEEKK